MAGREPRLHLGEVELEEVVRAGTGEMLARLGPVFTAEEEWADGLRGVAYELRDFLCEDDVRARAMVLEAAHGNEATRRVRERGIAALTVMIDAGRGGLGAADAPPPFAAEIAAGAIHNRIYAAVERGEELDERIVRELMYTAVLPYRGRAAALAELEAPPPRRG